jgi:hypothetical protein
MQKSTAEYFMFVDADVHFDPHSVLRLIRSGHEISVACYPKKFVDWDQAAVAARKGDERSMEMLSASLVVNFGAQRVQIVNGFAPVLDGPTGFMMIKRCVFEKMEKHYPELNCANDHQNRDFDYYHAAFDCMIDPDSRRYLSEDYAFCRRWQQMGGKIYADTQTTLGHVGNLPFNGRLCDRLNISKKPAPVPVLRPSIIPITEIPVPQVTETPVAAGTEAPAAGTEAPAAGTEAPAAGTEA